MMWIYYIFIGSWAWLMVWALISHLLKFLRVDPSGDIAIACLGIGLLPIIIPNELYYFVKNKIIEWRYRRGN